MHGVSYEQKINNCLEKYRKYEDCVSVLLHDSATNSLYAGACYFFIIKCKTIRFK